jgi:hypothetical protein
MVPPLSLEAMLKGIQTGWGGGCGEQPSPCAKGIRCIVQAMKYNMVTANR